jgi:hypothetical protein
MSPVLDPPNALKWHILLAILSFTTIGGAIATILHRLEPQTHWFNLIAPPLLTMISAGMFFRLYKSPQSLPQVINIGILSIISFVFVPSWFFTLRAWMSSGILLVNTLPPLASILFLLMMLLMITVRPRHLIWIALGTWVIIAAPILIYLILHPMELMTLRGLDLAISLGPSMAIQIVLILFFNRLQDLVDRLYQERIQYYERVIERQTMRQSSMEDITIQIRQRALPQLAQLKQQIKTDSLSSQELLQRLDVLDDEIQAIENRLANKGCDL